MQTSKAITQAPHELERPQYQRCSGEAGVDRQNAHMGESIGQDGRSQTEIARDQVAV